MFLTGQMPPKKPNKRPKNVRKTLEIIIFSLRTFILIQFVQLVLILFIHVINIDDDKYMKMMKLF